MKRTLLVLVGLALIAVGCAGAKTRPIAGGESAVAEAPTFKVGDEWRFAGPRYRSRVRVVSVDANGIVTTREVLTGPHDTCPGCRYFRDANLTLVKVLDAQGQPWPEAELGVKYLDFPLRVGKQWTQTMDLQSTGGPTYTYVNRFKVEAYEEITVKAGTFRAFRLAESSENVGAPWRAVRTTWWSPDVRWFVRIEAFRERGLSGAGTPGTDLELESYSLK